MSQSTPNSLPAHPSQPPKSLPIRILLIAFVSLFPLFYLYTMFFPLSKRSEFSAPPTAASHAAIADLDDIANALDDFVADIGRYPSTAEGLNALLTRPGGGGSGGARLRNWKGPYLPVIPTDRFSPTSQPYRYISPAPSTPNDPATYNLHSIGPDGIDNTLDDLYPEPVKQ